MSTPRINPNDPKWTAYVLGELDAREREAIERLLRSSAEARDLIDTLTLAAAALQESPDTDPAHVLTPAQRAGILRAAVTPRYAWFARLRLSSIWGSPWRLGTVTAAGLAAVLAALLMPGPGVSPPSADPARGSRSTAQPNTVPDTREVLTSPWLADTQQGTTPQTPSAGPVPQAKSVSEPLSDQPTASTSAADSSLARRANERRESAAAGGLTESAIVTNEAPSVDATASAWRTFAGAPAGAAGYAAGNAAANGPGSGGGALSDRFDRTGPPIGTESYARVAENGFVRTSREPLATFSIDVDTASFSNVRRFLNQNQLPPPDAVRIEELVNYFTYDYPGPSGSRPIGASMAVTAAPWNPRHRLVRIGVRARDLDAGRRPASNLVFLIDVSGSMDTPQKLPLVKSGLKLLVDQLGENDSVSIVVYASASGLVLPPTRGDRKDIITRALDNLQAGGSTNGGAGIQLAYHQATANFIRGGVNRVILVTDGDFNVGLTDQSGLTGLIEDRAKSGVFLSVLGFGMGNLKDSTMERLADTGNGHYAYIDTLSEARKVLVEQVSSTLVTVAKDVKIQVDFNPGRVEAYRLIGYENRVLRPEDFNNDLKDAGDMGAGHTVTALFEIVPRGGTVPGASVDPSVFQPATRTAPPPSANSGDLLVLRVRYKLPDAAESTRMDTPLPDRDVAFGSADADFRFAAAVAAFGMILKGSEHRGNATLAWVLETAAASQGQDRGGYRDEFVSLVRKAISVRSDGAAR